MKVAGASARSGEHADPRLAWRSPAALAALLLLLLLVAGPLRPANGAPEASFVVSEAGANQLSPEVDGNLVVWEDTRNGDFDVYARDLSLPTEGEFPVASGPGDQRNPDLSGDRVVWEETAPGASDRDVRVRDLAAVGADPITVASGVADQKRPAISGDKVVWEEDGGADPVLRGHDLGTGQAFVVSETQGGKRRPALDGDLVVWEDDRGGPGDSDIYAKDLSSGREYAVAAGPDYDHAPSVSGAMVVWSRDDAGDAEVSGKNLATGEQFRVTDDADDQWGPRISGTFVVWADGRGADADVRGEDLSTGEHYEISLDPGAQEGPSVSGSTVVGETQRTDGANFGSWDVRGSRIDLAPAAPANLRATGVASGVNLTWDANGEDDLAGYDVYRASSPDGPFDNKLNTATLGTPGFSDTGAPRGKVSYYQVRAVDNGGKLSAPSKASAAPRTATILTLAADKTEVAAGEAVAFTGRLTFDAPGGSAPAADEEVLLERRSGTGFVEAGRVSTDASGAFAFPQVRPDASTAYRARFAGHSEVGLQPSVSGPVAITVAPPISLTALVSPAELDYGKAARISGRLTSFGRPVAGRVVILEHRPVGEVGFAPTGRISTGATGGYVFTHRPQRNTEYRVRFAGGAGLLPITSSPGRVDVHAIVHTNLSDTEVWRGQRLAIYGTVVPTVNGTVEIKIEKQGETVSKQRISVSRVVPLSNGRYHLIYQPTEPGQYTVSVRFPGDRDRLLGGIGPTKRFTVQGA